MPALIEYFTDVTCTKELDKSGSIYELILGPITGLDGDLGDRVDYIIYAKNVGDQVGMAVKVVKEGDDKNFITISDGVTDYVKNELVLGDMKPGDIKAMFLKLVVPPNTDALIGSPTLTAAYRTLP